MSTGRAARSVFLVATGALLTACGPAVRVVTDLNPDADFSAYRTYQWTEGAPTAEVDRAVFNDIVVARIRQAIDSVLRAKGYEEVGQAPDLLVSWHGGVDVRTRYARYGPWGYPGRVRVEAWDQGTVLIEIVDANTGDLVWRGLGQTTLYQEPDAEKRQAMTGKSVAKIMEDLPRAGTP